MIAPLKRLLARLLGGSSWEEIRTRFPSRFALWRQNHAKPILFGLVGAAGVLAGALGGELALLATRKPPLPPTQAICLLIDCSGSMAGSKLAEVKQAAIGFAARQVQVRSVLTVVGFSSEAHLGASHLSDPSPITRAVKRLRAGGATRLDLGLRLATDQLGAASLLEGSSGKRFLVLFTDGMPDPPAYSGPALEIAETARRKGLQIVAVATADADYNYMAQIAGAQERVVRATPGQFEQAFIQAERFIGTPQIGSRGQEPQYSFTGLLFRWGIWTALLSLGAGLALVLGQNRYLRRALGRWGELGKAAGISLGVGLAAGVIVQLVYSWAGGHAGWAFGGRLAAWAVLGAAIGRVVAFLVPNFRILRAMVGGAAGGALGSLGFVVTAWMTGDAAGRLLGAVIFGFVLGWVIAVAEELARRAWLVVHWGPKETSNVSLGPQPVLIGSSAEAHVQLPRPPNAPPIVGAVRLVAGKVEYENRTTGRRQVLRNGEKFSVSNRTLEVRVVE